MTDRWRQPLQYTVTDDFDRHEVYHMPDGRVMRGVTKIYTLESFNRLHRGEGCLQCDDVFEVAFPEHCPLCDYPVRAQQKADLDREFVGTKWVGPNPEPELPAEPTKTKSGILVPRTAHLSKVGAVKGA